MDSRLPCVTWWPLHVELAVHLFADLATATSFLGVALGLFDYMADLFQRRNTVAGRLQTGR